MYKKIVDNWWLLVCIGWLLVFLACMLSGCNLGGSYTRVYQVEEYTIGAEGVDAVFTVEDSEERSEYFRDCIVYLHDGEDTVIVISFDKDGKGLSGLKNMYLYLNEDKYIEKIKDDGGE